MAFKLFKIKMLHFLSFGVRPKPEKTEVRRGYMSVSKTHPAGQPP